MYVLTLIFANTMYVVTLIVAYAMYCMHSVADTVYALIFIVAILIHTSCVCTATADLAGLLLYNNLSLEFSSTVTSTPYPTKIGCHFERALNKYLEVPVVPQSACE